MEGRDKHFNDMMKMSRDTRKTKFQLLRFFQNTNYNKEIVFLCHLENEQEDCMLYYSLKHNRRFCSWVKNMFPIKNVQLVSYFFPFSLRFHRCVGSLVEFSLCRKLVETVSDKTCVGGISQHRSVTVGL